MRALLPFLTLVVSLVLVAQAAMAEDEARAPRAYALGEFVEGISGPGLDGSPVSLDDLEISGRRARTVVLEVAGTLMKGQDVGLETPLGKLGEAGRKAVAYRVSLRFGIALTEEALGDLETLEDLAAWVEEHEDAPIVIVTWSPECSACKDWYTAKLARIHREDSFRMIVVACDAGDTPETLKAAVESQRVAWKVLLDLEQEISDRLGASRTPEVFVLDSEFRLRYRGAIDSSPETPFGEGKREFLREAVESLLMEEPVQILRTEPNGCPIKRKS